MFTVILSKAAYTANNSSHAGFTGLYDWHVRQGGSLVVAETLDHNEEVAAFAPSAWLFITDRPAE